MMRSTAQICDPETYLHKKMLLRPSFAIAPPLAVHFAPIPPKKRKVDDMIDGGGYMGADEVPLAAEAATNHQLISSQSKKRSFGDQIMPIGRSKVDGVEVPLGNHQLISSQSKKRGFGNQIITFGGNKVDNFQVSHAKMASNHQLISSQSKKRRFGEIMPVVGWSKVGDVEVPFAPASPDHHRRRRRFLQPYKKRRFETPDSHRTVNDFEVEHRLGEGSFGVVYKARDRCTGEHVALKKFQVQKGGEKGDEEDDQWREIEYMRLCRHPSVVQLREVVRDHDGKSLVMVMELGGHDLWTVLDAWPGKMQESHVRFLMSQLLQGVKCMHDNKIIHRDLKTSNVLLSTDGRLRICDFGLACKCNSGRQQNIQKVGTRWYKAPEMLLEAKDYTAAVDMWSVGCIMAELLTKEPLFPGATEEDQLSKIGKVLGAPTEKTLPGLKALPGASMIKRTKKRSRNQLYLKLAQEPKLSKQGLDLLKGLLMYDPAKRLTADAALDHPWFTISSYDVPIYYI